MLNAFSSPPSGKREEGGTHIKFGYGAVWLVMAVFSALKIRDARRVDFVFF